jgi:Kelch motif/Galactose oxidase, central domain
MSRFRSLLIACIAISLGAATAFRFSEPSTPQAGSVTASAPMLQPRSGHTATLLPDGRVLIAGGMRRNQDFYRSAELYDPASRSFQATGEMTMARVGQTATLLRSGKVLIAGGWIGHGSTNSAEIYDPASGKFTAISSMTARRGRPVATLLPNGDVLITGGADHDSPGGVALAEVFHASTLTFEAVGPMHEARVSHTATLLNDGRVLIVGGRGDVVTATAELFDPKTKQFTLTGNLATARYKHTAGLLPDGRVLIAGGSDERDWHGTMSTAEIYDPRTRKFTPTSSLHDSRFKLPEAAVQIVSGQLLIAGGSKQLEIYDPTSNKFLLASGQMNDARHFMTETKLEDGTVLLAGGYPDNPEATAQTWIYRPDSR